MGAFIPKWRPLDAVNSARLLSARPDEGGVAALCVSPGLAGSAEAAALAIDLAGSWAAAGLRVLLADGTVGTPSLHIPFGLPNEGGLADVLLAGAGWEPLTLPTGTPGLRLLPAGGGSGSTAPQDALHQLARLCSDSSAEGTLLALFVPLGSMVTEWVFGECTDIVVLSAEGENLQPFFDQDEDRIRALLGRPEGPSISPAPFALAADPVPGDAPATGDVASATTSRPPRATRTPPSGAAERGTSAARSERRPPPLAGSPPPTARIEEAWARAAAQLRATLETNPEAMGDLFSQPPPPSPEPKPTEPTSPPGAEAPRATGPAPEPPAAPEPMAKAPPPSRPAAKAPPASKPAAKAPSTPKPKATSRPDSLPLLEPLGELPPVSKPARPRSRTEPAGGVEPPPRPPAPPSSSRPPRPPPRTWTPLETPAAEEPPKLFAEPDLPPPLPLLDSWDPEFGADEAHDRARAARWRRLGRNGLLGLAGVALVATVVVVRDTGRGMPPLEVPVTPFPRATVESEATATAEATPDGPEVGTAEAVEQEPAQAGGAVAAPGSASSQPPVAASAQPPAVVPTENPTSGTAPPALSSGTPHQRFSWSIAALGTFQKARDLAARLGRAVPDQAFMVAPIVSDGRTLYRVLGGLAEDRPSLVAQRGSLGERTRLDASTWFVREAPSAFLLDEFSDGAAAQSRVQALWGAGIPAYALVVDRQDGSVGHRVYAGAYASEQEAEPLLAMLRGAGITGMTFTERRGRVAR